MSETFLWLIAAFALFILEILTPGVFFFACLGIGALASSLVSFIGAGSLISWIVFLFVSPVSIYFIRPIAKKYLRTIRDEKKKSNIDALVGRRATLLEKSSPETLGLVKIEGEFWKVSSENEIEPGSIVEVVSVEGAHLVVKKANN